GRQDCGGLRCDHCIVFCHKEEVGSSCLLHLGPCGGIKVHVLVKSLLMGVNDGVQAHGVVQTCLYMTCAVGSCPVVVTYPDSDRLSATLEVGAYRCRKYRELVLCCRFYADNRVGTEHVRPDIERSP